MRVLRLSQATRHDQTPPYGGLLRVGWKRYRNMEQMAVHRLLNESAGVTGCGLAWDKARLGALGLGW